MYYYIKVRVFPTIALGPVYCIMFYADRKIDIDQNGVKPASKQSS